MSKLAFILYAAACFCSAMAGSLSRIDRNSADGILNTAIMGSRERLMEIRQQISDVKSLPRKQNFDIIEEFKQNITRDLDLARVFVADIVDNSTTSFNETECRSYFLDYEKTAQNVLSNLDVCVSRAFNVTLTELEKAENTTIEATKKLEHFRREVIGCSSLNCDSINDRIQKIYRDVLRETADIFCSHKKLSNGVKIREVVQKETQYNYHLEKGYNLIKNTLICVNYH